VSGAGSVGIAITELIIGIRVLEEKNFESLDAGERDQAYFYVLVINTA
jgi:hypothetical protein